MLSLTVIEIDLNSVFPNLISNYQVFQKNRGSIFIGFTLLNYHGNICANSVDVGINLISERLKRSLPDP